MGFLFFDHERFTVFLQHVHGLEQVVHVFADERLDIDWEITGFVGDLERHFPLAVEIGHGVLSVTGADRADFYAADVDDVRLLKDVRPVASLVSDDLHDSERVLRQVNDLRYASVTIYAAFDGREFGFHTIPSPCRCAGSCDRRPDAGRSQGRSPSRATRSDDGSLARESRGAA